MTGDNWIFDVNGYEKDHLKAIINLALMQTGNKIVGYTIDVTRGIILYWYVPDDKTNVVVFPLQNFDLIIETIWAFLKETKWAVSFEKWEEDADHDGHNTMGFRVKTGNWGHIDYVGHSAFLLIKPIYIWFGK